ncbi:hypothetical protein GCM10023172_30710 [Hymenobacter ginsengisoli]|uniref:Lipocalin-like domain-containing protein n=1 Tax=Hymenobacter ginsengisoli TaxID=1051626 RepID=A0ABP8QJZ1_9BACT|nr:MULTISPECIES: hypothetical protein [unclassified Hymenobacter]MBO2033316.1 hypothetical protein [Hymenobacter sp. BT559]
MRKLLLYGLLLSAAQLATGCQQDVDIGPASYDELALAAGHWEWDQSTLGWAGNRSPATEGYTRQLVFGAGGKLLLRRRGQPDYHTTYQLSMGTLPRCGMGPASLPIITYSTQEEKLPNNERRTYTIEQRNSQQVLRIVGEDACVDGGAIETYHWVAD